LTVTTLSNPLLSDELLMLDPVGTTSTTGPSFLFAGRAGSAFTSGLTWTNSSGGSGSVPFPGGNVSTGWDWSVSIPLTAGLNNVTFSGVIPTSATQTYADSPMNYNTFVAEQGQGTGFGVWYFDHSAANAGSFLADNPSNMNVGTTKGFGLWANNGGRAAITRSFATPMKSGDSFNVKFDNNLLDNSAQVGFELRDPSNNVRFRFFFVGGESNYRVVDAAGNRTTPMAYTQAGLNLTLTLGVDNAYTFNTGAGEITGNLASGDPIAWVQFFNQNAGQNAERNVYVGAMTHTVATTGQRTVTASGGVTRTGSSAYGDWLGEVPASDEMLLKYAIGGAAAPTEEGSIPGTSSENESGDFVLTAIVRDDAALDVIGKTTAALVAGGWTTNGVTTVESADQSAAPAGCKVVEYRVSAAGGSRFLRLEVTHTP
jgi:hypothetical protein